jgi:hypothetical protein
MLQERRWQVGECCCVRVLQLVQACRQTSGRASHPAALLHAWLWFCELLVLLCKLA